MNTEFHCHILPGFDDGSESTEMSLEMLRNERSQGIDRVILTSHFYRYREETAHFLKRRREAFEKLTAAVKEDGGDFPELILGAEVAMTKELLFEDLRSLCIEGTRTMLLELPFEPMGSWFGDVERIIHQNSVKVILAHVERFRSSLDRKSFKKVMALPVMKQVNTTSLYDDGFFMKRELMKWIAADEVHILGSDAHNLTDRPVNWDKAFKALEDKGMKDKIRLMMRNAEKVSS